MDSLLSEDQVKTIINDYYIALGYKGSKYWFSLAKTSSDKKRSGKNLTSDITKTLSVYKK